MPNFRFLGETSQSLTDLKVKVEPEDFQERFPPQDDIPCPSPTFSNHSEDQVDPLSHLQLGAGEGSDSSDDDDGSTSSDGSHFYITPDNDKKRK